MKYLTAHQRISLTIDIAEELMNAAGIEPVWIEHEKGGGLHMDEKSQDIFNEYADIAEEILNSNGLIDLEGEE